MTRKSKRVTGRRLIPLIAGTVAALALFLSNLKTIEDWLSGWLHPGTKQATIELVSTAVANGDTIDVTLLNPSSTTAVVSRADLRVKRAWRVMYQRQPIALILRTGTYDFETPFEGAPYSKTKQLQHVLKPNEPDRLGFTLRGQASDYFVLFDIVLHHSGRGGTLISEPVLHYFRGDGEGLPTHTDFLSAEQVLAGSGDTTVGPRSTYILVNAANVRRAYVHNDSVLMALSAVTGQRTSSATKALGALANASQANR